MYLDSEFPSPSRTSAFPRTSCAPGAT